MDNPPIDVGNSQNVQASHLFSSLKAGFVIGFITVIACVSFAALIFTEELFPYLPTGIGLTLFSGMIVGAIAAIMSSYPGMIASPQHTTAAILALITHAIAVSLAATASEEDIFLTVIALIVFNSLVTGILFFAVGWFRLGELIRFIPYPVIGGFLAGTGWLLVEGSFQMMTQTHWHFSHLLHLFDAEILIKWLPGVIFGLLLFIIFQRTHNLMIITVAVLGGIFFFYFITAITGTEIEFAKAEGLLLGYSPQHSVWHPISLLALTHAKWSAIWQQIPSLATIWLIDLIGLLLGVSSLEIVLHRDINLNSELKTAGIASFVSGLGNGMSGYPLVSETAMIYKLKEAKRIVGLIAAAYCAVILIWGISFLAYCPKLIVGGVLILIGLELLVEWVYSTWFKLPLADYGIIVLILLTIMIAGFLPGVIIGIIAAVILFAINYSQISITKHTFSGATHQSHVQRLPSQEAYLQEKGQQIYILELQGLIFFGTAHKLLNQIRQRLNNIQLPPVKFLILDFRLVSGLDTSAVLSFVKLKQMASQHQFSVLLTHLSPANTVQLQQGKVLEDQNSVCQTFPDIDRALEWCENQLLATQVSMDQDSLSLEEQLKIFLGNAEDALILIPYLKPVQLIANDVLFEQGDVSDGLYFLESGQVSVILHLAVGKTKRLRTYQSGTILGEIGLYRKAPRSASVVADTPSSLYYLSLEAFTQIENHEPRLAASFHKFIVNLLTERLHRRESELRNLLL